MKISNQLFKKIFRSHFSYSPSFLPIRQFSSKKKQDINSKTKSKPKLPQNSIDENNSQSNLLKPQKYRTKAAYKLLEIDDQFRFINSCRRVIELGCCPGGWTEVLIKRCPNNAIIVSIDREKMLPIDLKENKKQIAITYLETEIFQHETNLELAKLFNLDRVDLIICDIDIEVESCSLNDSERILAHIKNTMTFVLNTLEVGGKLLFKGYRNLHQKMNKEYMELYFKNVVMTQPLMSRLESSELYYYCTGFGESKLIDTLNEKKNDFEYSDFCTHFPEINRMTEFQRKKMFYM